MFTNILLLWHKRAVVYNKGKAVRLSRDMTPYSERQRILALVSKIPILNALINCSIGMNICTLVSMNQYPKHIIIIICVLKNIDFLLHLTWLWCWDLVIKYCLQNCLKSLGTKQSCNAFMLVTHYLFKFCVIL